MKPVSWQPGDQVHLLTAEHLAHLSHQKEAERLLIQPRRLGRVGEIYFEPATQRWHTRVYWQIAGQWYAVNLPVQDFEKA